MAGSVNKATILGNVGRDPEIRSFQNGGRVANFTVATSESWRDKNTGEKREKTEWHNVSVTSDALVGIVEKYVSKGSKVYVEGKLQTRKWQDQSGQDRYSTEIVVGAFGGQIVLLNGGGNSQESQRSAPPVRDVIEDEIPW